jgi:hypothetical protein
VPPNATYAALQGLETTVEKKRQLFRSVKRKLAPLAEKTQYTQLVALGIARRQPNWVVLSGGTNSETRPEIASLFKNQMI